MPRQFYPGDSSAVKMSAINLVNNYDFGFKTSNSSQISQFLGHRGQYFAENESSEKLYSRWGVFATLVSAVPELFNVDQQEMAINKSTIFHHNVFNIFLSVIVGILLYRICSFYSENTLTNLIFTLSTLYSTFVFNYLRVQSYEVLQLLLFLSLFYSIIKPQKKLLHFSLWSLILIKKVYILLYIPVALDSLFIRYSFNKKTFLQLFISALIPLSLIALANKLQFGVFLYKENPVDFPFDPSKIAFSLSYIPTRLKEYLIGPRASIFLFFPLLIVAIFRYKKFYQSYKSDSIFIFASFLTMFLLFINFHTIGQACYGPRFLLFVLPLLSLPLLVLLNEFFTDLKSRKNIIGLTLFSTLTIYSTYIHSSINKHPYFLTHELQEYFHNQPDKDIDYYFKNTFSPFLVIDYDYAVKRKQNYYPLEVRTSALSEKLKHETYERFSFQAKNVFCNYYWNFVCTKYN